MSCSSSSISDRESPSSSISSSSISDSISLEVTFAVLVNIQEHISSSSISSVSIISSSSIAFTVLANIQEHVSCLARVVYLCTSPLESPSKIKKRFFLIVHPPSVNRQSLTYRHNQLEATCESPSSCSISSSSISDSISTNLRLPASLQVVNTGTNYP